MVNRKLVIVILNILIIGLLTSCGEEANPNNFPQYANATSLTLDSESTKKVLGSASRQQILEGTGKQGELYQFATGLAQYAGVTNSESIDWSKVKISAYKVTNSKGGKFLTLAKEVKKN